MGNVKNEIFSYIETKQKVNFLLQIRSNYGRRLCGELRQSLGVSLVVDQGSAGTGIAQCA